jgi:hypothetical protein
MLYDLRGPDPLRAILSHNLGIRPVRANPALRGRHPQCGQRKDTTAAPPRSSANYPYLQRDSGMARGCVQDQTNHAISPRAPLLSGQQTRTLAVPPASSTKYTDPLRDPRIA